MARMLGAWSKSWCPTCKAPAGADCADVSVTKKARRATEKKAWGKEAREQMPGNDRCVPHSS
jgi:hypothetical protein